MEQLEAKPVAKFAHDPFPSPTGEAFVFGPRQTAWLEALESGKYSQASGMLKNPTSGAYCCLGVLCEVEGLVFDPQGFIFSTGAGNGYLTNEYAKGIGLKAGMGTLEHVARLDDMAYSSLGQMNDSWNFGFKDIAAYIRHDPWNVFDHSA